MFFIPSTKQSIFVNNAVDYLGTSSTATYPFGAVDYHYHGRSLSVSRDGFYCIVGSIGADVGIVDSQGEVYFYYKPYETKGAWQDLGSLYNPANFNDEYGASVAINSDGSTAIVGAPLHDRPSHSNAGAAYVYTRSGYSWSLQTQLLAGDVYFNSNFGKSVALSDDGNTAAIGAPGHAGDGAVYVFTRSGSTWSQQAKIVPNTTGTNNSGISVDLSADGNTLIIGNSTGSSSTGRAYIYTRSGSSWSLAKTLSPPIGSSSGNYGHSVALSADGTVAVIGEIYATVSGYPEAGRVHTRSGTGWNGEEVINVSSPQNYEDFGWSVSISSDGNLIAAGAIGTNSGIYSAVGAVYIIGKTGTNTFQYSDGGPFISVTENLYAIRQRILPDGPAGSWLNTQQGYQYFGWSTSLSGDGQQVTISSPFFDGTEFIYLDDSGTVYEYIQE